MGTKSSKSGSTPVSSNSIKTNDPFDNYNENSSSSSPIKSTISNNNNNNSNSTTNTTSQPQQQSNAAAVSAATPAEQLYETYKAVGHDVDDDNNEYISGDGVWKLAEDLSIDPTSDVNMLILLYKLQCKPQFRLYKKDFISTLNSLRITKTVQLKDNLSSWKREIYNDNKEFKKFYGFCFKNNLEGNQKTLVIEIAVPTWKLVLPEKCKFLNDWCEFIETDFKKAISKDTWDILVDFINQVPDFDKYDDSSAWPTAIDEFVAFYKKKHGK